MRFTDINLFGVYVAPISVMMVAAWLILIGLRRIATPFGLLRHVWHPATVRVRGLRDRAVVHRPRHCALRPCDGLTSNSRSDRAAPDDDDASDVADHPASEPPPTRSRSRIIPILITLATFALAVPLGWATWDAYMGTPWTRDGTVRVHVVTMASEVAGRIVELPVVDNQFVHKGDLLMAIDPTNYRLAVSLAEAAAQQAQIVQQNLQLEAKRRLELNNSAVSVEQQQTYESQA